MLLSARLTLKACLKKMKNSRNISTENTSTEEETVLCFECDKCDDKFVAQDDLEGHMDVTHINPNYFCDKCEFSSVGKHYVMNTLRICLRNVNNVVKCFI